MEAIALVVPSHPFHHLSGPLPRDLTEGDRNTLGGRCKQYFFSPISIQGFLNVKESHLDTLCLGGLEAVADGLRDSENSILAGA